MTTAKPTQRPTGKPAAGKRNQPRFRSWRSGNRTTDASKTPHQHRRRDHKKQHSLPSNEKPPQDETQPNRIGRMCRDRPLVPVGSTPRGASTSGLSNTCSTCGLQAPKCQGILILEQASRLDAFSGYPSRTWPTSRAAGATTGIPEVRPPRSSRTMGRPPQDSNERRG